MVVLKGCETGYYIKALDTLATRYPTQPVIFIDFVKYINFKFSVPIIWINNGPKF